MGKSRVERRKHKRHELSCPVRLEEQSGGGKATFRCVNVSDGGMLLPLPRAAAPAPGRQVQVSFSVPRSTPNTFLWEEFTSRAIVVRHEPADGEGTVRVAVRFDRPLDLQIEV